MTRRHFEHIAQAIARIENPRERRAQADKLAAMCAELNPRFDRERFMAACNAERR